MREIAPHLNPEKYFFKSFVPPFQAMSIHSYNQTKPSCFDGPGRRSKDVYVYSLPVLFLTALYVEWRRKLFPLFSFSLSYWFWCDTNKSEQGDRLNFQRPRKVVLFFYQIQTHNDKYLIVKIPDLYGNVGSRDILKFKKRDLGLWRTYLLLLVLLLMVAATTRSSRRRCSCQMLVGCCCCCCRDCSLDLVGVGRLESGSKFALEISELEDWERGQDSLDNLGKSIGLEISTLENNEGKCVS